jgi:hypothetical protein
LPAAVEVICPGCQGSFLVPFGIAETLCPYCDEHIVWRRCLDTDEVFPVLTKWATWVHPGCDSEHLVDLTVHITQPAGPDAADELPGSGAELPGSGAELPASAYTPPPPPPPSQVSAVNAPAPTLADALPGLDRPPVGEMLPAESAPPPPSLTNDGYSTVQQYGAPTLPPVLLLDHAEWLEQRVAGQLLVVHDQLVIVARGTAQPVTLAPVRDIAGYSVAPDEGAGMAEPAKKKRFRRGAQVEDPTTPLRLNLSSHYAHWTIVGRGDLDVVRSQLAALAPNATGEQSPDNASPAFLGWSAGPQQPPVGGGQAPWGQ